MKFPDPNIGYVFGYQSEVTSDAIIVSFLGGSVNIVFRYANIAQAQKEVYSGGRISWDVIRWGRCPRGQEALKLVLRKGAFKNHLIVFDDLDLAVRNLRNYFKGAIP